MPALDDLFEYWFSKLDNGTPASAMLGFSAFVDLSDSNSYEDDRGRVEVMAGDISKTLFYHLAFISYAPVWIYKHFIQINYCFNSFDVCQCVIVGS